MNVLKLINKVSRQKSMYITCLFVYVHNLVFSKKNLKIQKYCLILSIFLKDENMHNLPKRGVIINLLSSTVKFKT